MCVFPTSGCSEISLIARRTWEFRTCTTISVRARPQRWDRYWRVCRSADSEELERSLSQYRQRIRVKIQIKKAAKLSKPLFKWTHRGESPFNIATTTKRKTEWTNNQPSTTKKKSNDCRWQEQAVKKEEYVFTKRRQITDIRKTICSNVSTNVSSFGEQSAIKKRQRRLLEYD